MGDIVFNIAKGRAGAYVQNVKNGSPANSRLKVIPIEAANIASDATLRDYDNLSALLAGSTNEQTTMGRKTVVAADITLTVDDVNDRLDVTMADIVWTAATGASLGAIVVAYFPDGVTPGADSTAIPLTKHDFVVTPDGADITADIGSSGFYRAS